MKTYYVYIMANDGGTIYIGVSNNLERRVNEHRDGMGSKFTAKYRCHKLVYFESYSFIYDALARENELKSWRRDKKVRLIEIANPEWQDLFTE